MTLKEFSKKLQDINGTTLQKNRGVEELCLNKIIEFSCVVNDISEKAIKFSIVIDDENKFLTTGYILSTSGLYTITDINYTEHFTKRVINIGVGDVIKVFCSPYYAANGSELNISFHLIEFITLEFATIAIWNLSKSSYEYYVNGTFVRVLDGIEKGESLHLHYIFEKGEYELSLVQQKGHLFYPTIKKKQIRFDTTKQKFEFGID